MSAIDTDERKTWPRDTIDHRFTIGPREGLTKRQSAILAMFENAYVARDPMPTQRELAEEFQVNINAIAGRLEILRRKGWIEWEPRKARSIKLTAKAIASITASR